MHISKQIELIVLVPCRGPDNSAEQIEKELLAVVFACNKFHQYIYGYPTNVQRDHKPLEVIMLKPLYKVSPRLQRMLLKLQKYDLHLHYTKGKELYVADTLSRAYLHVPSTDNDEDDLEFAVHSLVRDLPVSDSRLSELQSATASDIQMQQLHEYITTGWPANISSVPLSLRTFWNLRNDLHAAENLILINNCIVIPAAMRPDVSIKGTWVSRNQNPEPERVCIGQPCTVI